MNDRSIRCEKCGLQVPCPSWGFFYVIDNEGNKLILERQLESAIIADALGINEDDISGCVFSPERSEASVKLMQERVGYKSFCLCRTCLEQCSFDKNRDIVECPSCGSKDVMMLIQLIGTRCPNCKEGKLVENEK
ncbi:MAG: hypothetical protein ACYDHW_06810 [Syntrophorhabdaceae bacterium]